MIQNNKSLGAKRKKNEDKLKETLKSMRFKQRIAFDQFFFYFVMSKFDIKIDLLLSIELDGFAFDAFFAIIFVSTSTRENLRALLV